MYAAVPAAVTSSSSNILGRGVCDAAEFTSYAHTQYYPFPLPPPQEEIEGRHHHHHTGEGSSSSASSSIASSNSGSGVWYPNSNDNPNSPPGSPIMVPSSLSSSHAQNQVFYLLPEQQQEQEVNMNSTTPQRFHRPTSSSHHQTTQLLNHATPRTYNGNKRRLPPVPLVTLGGGGGTAAANRDTTSSSSSLLLSSNSNSCSSFDCQSLQHSLKRVRLSSSPGELRLQSDLRQLVLNGPWEQVHEDEWACPLQQCRLERSSVDPLCLRFFWRNATCTLRFPRMYPHQPPTLSSTTIMTCNNNSVFGSSSTNHHQHHHQTIPLPTAPPTIIDSSSWTGGTSDVRGAAATIFGGWLPTMQLSDVLDYLAETIANNSGNSSNVGDCRGVVVWQDGGENDGSMIAHQDSTSSVGEDEHGNGNEVHDNNNNNDDDDSTTCAHNLSSNPDFNDDDDDDITMTTTTTTTFAVTGACSSIKERVHDETEDEGVVSSPSSSLFLTPNRFDVGYQRHCSESSYNPYYNCYVDQRNNNFGVGMDTSNF